MGYGGERNESSGKPNLIDLDRWLSEQVKCRQQLLRRETGEEKTQPQKRDQGSNLSRVSTLSTQVEESPSRQNGVDSRSNPYLPTSPLCNQGHNIYRCDKFAKMSIAERLETVKRLRLCFNCVQENHIVR